MAYEQFQFCLPPQVPPHLLHACFDEKYGQRTIIAAPYQQQQYTIRQGTVTPEFAPLVQSIVSHQPRELFPGAVLVAGLVTTLGVGAAGVPAALSGILTGARSVAQSGGSMALNVAGLLQGIGGLASTVGGATGFSALGSLGHLTTSLAPLAGAFAPPQTYAAPSASFMAQPVAQYSPYQFQLPAQQGPMALPVSQSSTAIAIRTLTQPILFKIAQKLGLSRIPSLRTVITWILKMAKLLAPGAVATTLGIELGELATLITANARRKRRRMNPSNTKALRRSLRRLGSFERLSDRVHCQLSVSTAGARRRPGRRRGRSCVTCKSNPCRC